MGHELASLETGINGNDQECRLVADRDGVKGPEEVESGDEKAPICCSWEVHWGGGRC